MLSRSAKLRALLLAVPAAALLVALVAGGSAGAAEIPAPAPENGKDVVKIVLKGKKLSFEAPATVYEGDELEVLNETNPKQVGPHTFSLVEKSALPKTKQAEKNCFTPKHICFSIAEWHKFNPKTEKIGLNPVKAGPAGWSTLGNTSGKKGDSWFTGETKSGTHFSQTVSAKAGTTLYFMCAIHPWMQGSIKVLPKPAV
jgi:plastocyanin